MNDPLIIRPLHKDEPYPMDLLLLADPEEKMIRTYITTGSCYVAEVNGAIAGTYVVLPTRPHTLEIMNIAVAEPMQGQRIGQAMLQHAIQTSKNQGVRILEIKTGNSSIGQLAFYQKNGFRMTEIETDYFVHHYSEPIYENGIQCRDRIVLRQSLSQDSTCG